MCLWLVSATQAADIPRLMPLGDSITAGWNQPSYRMALARALARRGCEVDFVGNQTLTSRTPLSPHRYPGLHFPTFSSATHPGYAEGEHWDPSLGDDTDHAGYPGAKAEELLKMTWVEVRQSQPDYVLLHVGTNDIVEAVSVHSEQEIVQFAIQTVGKINEIVEAIFSSHRDPANMKILLANLIPNDPQRREKIWVNEPEMSRTLSRYIGALVEGKKDHRLILVDVASDFDVQSMTTDGVHPNFSGEQHIARAFLHALEQAGLCPSPESAGRNF